MRRAPPAQPAAVALALSLLLRLVNAGSMGPGVPENITVTFLNPTTVRVSWSTTADLVEKYDVTYKPSDASKEEKRLSWYGHLLRRDVTHATKCVLSMNVDGRRGKGRPKKRWIDCMTSDRGKWKRMTYCADPK
ncbi:hypothetical protein B5X24_HaOG216249 [Helicoverpa armigera]|nr:hypothetical protein B5X24_HaOG216249 [Helicoverpa armigera]